MSYINKLARLLSILQILHDLYSTALLTRSLVVLLWQNMTRKQAIQQFSPARPSSVAFLVGRERATSTFLGSMQMIQFHYRDCHDLPSWIGNLVHLNPPRRPNKVPTMKIY